MSEQITSTPESINSPYGETVAYLLPDQSGSGLDLIVDPKSVPNIARVTEETKQEPILSNLELEPTRLTQGIEKALKLKVASSEVLPISLLDRESDKVIQPSNRGWIEHDELVPEAENKTNDEALYGNRENEDFANVTNWIRLQLEGSESRLLDPKVPEYLGALLAREVKERETKSHTVFLENHSAKRPESIKLVDEKGFDQASAITDEHHTADLAEAIEQDRKKLSQSAKRIGHLVTTKIKQVVPGHTNHDDHLLAA